MKASFWQRGESLDYTNSTTSTIENGQVVVIGDHIGIAGDDIDPSETGTLHVAGVFEFTKVDKTAIAMGKTVYFNGTGITTTATDNTAAGYAAADAAAADTTILVRIG